MVTSKMKEQGIKNATLQRGKRIIRSLYVNAHRFDIYIHMQWASSETNAFVQEAFSCLHCILTVRKRGKDYAISIVQIHCIFINTQLVCVLYEFHAACNALIQSDCYYYCVLVTHSTTANIWYERESVRAFLCLAPRLNRSLRVSAYDINTPNKSWTFVCVPENEFICIFRTHNIFYWND